jgi:hypothetical protein
MPDVALLPICRAEVETCSGNADIVAQSRSRHVPSDHYGRQKASHHHGHCKNEGFITVGLIVLLGAAQPVSANRRSSKCRVGCIRLRCLCASQPLQLGSKANYEHQR